MLKGWTIDMKCSKCGSDIRDGATFCGLCGEKIASSSDNTAAVKCESVKPVEKRKTVFNKNIILVISILLAVIVAAVVITYFIRQTQSSYDTNNDYSDETGRMELLPLPDEIKLGTYYSDYGNSTLILSESENEKALHFELSIYRIGAWGGSIFSTKRNEFLFSAMNYLSDLETDSGSVSFSGDTIIFDIIKSGSLLSDGMTFVHEDTYNKLQESQHGAKIHCNYFDDEKSNQAVSILLNSKICRRSDYYGFEDHGLGYVLDVVEGATFSDFFCDKYFEDYMWAVSERRDSDYLRVEFIGYPLCDGLDKVEYLFDVCPEIQTYSLAGIIMYADGEVGSYTVYAEDARGTDSYARVPEDERFGEFLNTWDLVISIIADDLIVKRYEW